MFEQAETEPVRSSRRMRFSIRTLLILVTIVAIGIAGGRWWISHNTTYVITATVLCLPVGDLGFKRDNETELIDLQQRFGYQQDGRNALAGPLKENPSIYCFPSQYSIQYKTEANYFNFNEKISEMKEQIMAMIDRNPDFRFNLIRIESKAYRPVRTSWDDIEVEVIDLAEKAEQPNPNNQ